jgi:hypothetical protein
MMQINNISINLVELPETGGVKTFNITGDDGAKFILIVNNSSGNYYDFKNKTFSSGHGPNKMLKSSLSGGNFQGSIIFPSAAGANYDILLIADPTDDTVMRRGKPINKRLKQLGNTTLTLSPATESDLYYNTLPSDLAITNSPTAASSSSSLDWTFTNSDSDAAIGDGFGAGLIFNSVNTANTVILDDAWYFNTTGTVDGATSSSTALVVDSVDNLFIGMSITSGLTGFSGSKPVVLKIASETKTLTLNKAASASDGATLTFNGYGISNINNALGCNIDPQLRIQNVSRVATTVRGAVNNSTTITVDGTYGIHASAEESYFTGLNVDASGAAVDRSTASATAGDLTASGNQTFKGGETLTFYMVDKDKLLTTTFQISGTIVVNSHPSSDVTVYFDLDKFITPGSDA